MKIKMLELTASTEDEEIIQEWLDTHPTVVIKTFQVNELYIYIFYTEE